MVRTYKRKTTQHSWSEDSMKLAITDVRNNVFSCNEAAVEYRVPLSTLFRRVKSEKDETSASKKRLGRFRPVFSQAQEDALAAHILSMEERLFGLSVYDLRSLAFQFADKNNVKHSFNTETELAGRDWVQNFLRRHKEISLRQPENTSAARAAAFNKPNVDKVFALLGSLMDQFHFSPSRIYNCDETGLTTVPNKPSKILSLKGKKQVGTLSSAERGQLITVEICFNAIGQYIPPLFVIPRVRRNHVYEIGLPPESVVEYHSSGWIQSSIFANSWFKHFLRFAKPTAEDPVLLIFDGHSTHTKNLELVTLAKANNVHILVIPPHTSHRLQPLDVSFMFPLSTYYEQEVKRWLQNNPGRVVTIHEVGQLFGAAYSRAATTNNALSGFENTGICPYNPHIFPDHLFKPAETTDRSFTATSDQDDNNAENAFQTAQTPQSFELNESSEPIHKTPSPERRPSINYERTSPQPGPSNINKRTSSFSDYISPQDIMPIPKSTPAVKPRKKKCKTWQDNDPNAHPKYKRTERVPNTERMP